MEEMETLSDHRYLLMNLYLPRLTSTGRRSRRIVHATRSLEDGSHPQLRRWAIKKLDEKKMMTAIYAASWAMGTGTTSSTNADLVATQFQRKLQEIYDIAMPRYRWGRNKNIYW